MQKTPTKQAVSLPCQSSETAKCAVSHIASCSKHIDSVGTLAVHESESGRNVTPNWSISEASKHRTLAEVLAFNELYGYGDSEGVVYFIQDRNCDLAPIKIGRSTQLRTRVQNIQSALRRRGFVADLQVLATMPGDAEIETYLHYAFADFGIPFSTFGASEWYRAEKPLLDFIAELTSKPPVAQTVIGGVA